MVRQRHRPTQLPLILIALHLLLIFRLAVRYTTLRPIFSTETCNRFQLESPVKFILVALGWHASIFFSLSSRRNVLFLILMLICPDPVSIGRGILGDMTQMEQFTMSDVLTGKSSCAVFA